MWVTVCGKILAPKIEKVFGTKDESSLFSLQGFLNSSRPIKVNIFCVWDTFLLRRMSRFSAPEIQSGLILQFVIFHCLFMI